MKYEFHWEWYQSDVSFKGLSLWKAEIAIIKCSPQQFLEVIHPYMKRSGHIYETLGFINSLLCTVYCIMQTIVTLVRYRFSNKTPESTANHF